LKVSVRARDGTFPAQEIRFQIRMKQGDFISSFETFGITDTKAVQDEVHDIPVNFFFNGEIFQTSLRVRYSAKPGVSGVLVK
jgi:hypothetical protein